MIVIGTIGACIQHGYHIRAWCHSCRHNEDLDLPALGERLGLDHSSLAKDLTPRLRCSKCGGRDIGLILSPYLGETQTGYTSRY